MRDFGTRAVVDIGGLDDEALGLLVAEYGLEPAADRDGLVRQVMAHQNAEVVELSQQEEGVPHTFLRRKDTFLYSGDHAEVVVTEEAAAKAAKKSVKKVVKKAAKKAPPNAEVVALGNGYYQVGDKKFHGIKALEKAGYEAP